MSERACPPYLGSEMIVPFSRQTTEVFKTGTRTSVSPCFVEKISPCRAACPAGKDIPIASRAAAQGDYTPHWPLFWKKPLCIVNYSEKTSCLYQLAL